MQDRSIESALLALRKQIIREGGGGLEHVEALLRLRGVARRPKVIVAPAYRGDMQRAVLAALRGGPMTRTELVAAVAAAVPDMPPQRAYWRVDGALRKLRVKGVVQSCCVGDG